MKPQNCFSSIEDATRYFTCCTICTCMFLVYWCRTFLEVTTADKACREHLSLCIPAMQIQCSHCFWLQCHFSLKELFSHAGLGSFFFSQTVWFPVAIKEDFRFTDISLVKGGPGVRGPPWTQLRPFSLSPSLGTLPRMPTLTPACLLFGMCFLSAAGSVRFKYETGCVLSFSFFFSLMCFSGAFFFSFSRLLIGFPGLFFFLIKIYCEERCWVFQEDVFTTSWLWIVTYLHKWQLWNKTSQPRLRMKFIFVTFWHATVFPVRSRVRGWMENHGHESCWVYVATIEHFLATWSPSPGLDKLSFLIPKYLEWPSKCIEEYRVTPNPPAGTETSSLLQRIPISVHWPLLTSRLHFPQWFYSFSSKWFHLNID